MRTKTKSSIETRRSASVKEKAKSKQITQEQKKCLKRTYITRSIGSVIKTRTRDVKPEIKKVLRGAKSSKEVIKKKKEEKKTVEIKSKRQEIGNKLKRKRSEEKTKVVNKRQKTSEKEKSVCERRSISLRSGRKTGTIKLTNKNKNLKTRADKNKLVKSKKSSLVKSKRQSKTSKSPSKSSSSMEESDENLEAEGEDSNSSESSSISKVASIQNEKSNSDECSKEKDQPTKEPSNNIEVFDSDVNSSSSKKKSELQSRKSSSISNQNDKMEVDEEPNKSCSQKSVKSSHHSLHFPEVKEVKAESSPKAISAASNLNSNKQISIKSSAAHSSKQSESNKKSNNEDEDNEECSEQSRSSSCSSSDSSSSSSSPKMEKKKSASREELKLQYYIQLFEKQAMQEERKRKRKEAREEKKKNPNDLPQSPSKGKYQGKRKLNRRENKDIELKIEIDRDQSDHRERKQSTDEQHKKIVEKSNKPKDSKDDKTNLCGQHDILKRFKNEYEAAISNDEAAVVLKADEIISDRCIDPATISSEGIHPLMMKKTFTVERIRDHYSSRLSDAIKLNKNNSYLEKPTKDDSVEKISSCEEKIMRNPQEFEMDVEIPKESEGRNSQKDPISSPSNKKIEECKEYEKTPLQSSVKHLESELKSNSSAYESQCQANLKELYIKQMMSLTKQMQSQRKFVK